MGEAVARLWQERAPHGPWLVHKADGHQVNFGSDKADAEEYCAALNCRDALVKALTEARAAIAAVPMEALGYASAENNQAHWPIRDELLHNINEALAKVST